MKLDPLGDNKSLVELLDDMGDDLAVVNAARVSHDKFHEELQERDANMLRYMGHHEPVPHWSPFAHPQVQFRIRVPIFVARQWTRSNVGTTRNEVSRRYVDDEPEFYTPRAGMWRRRPDAYVKQGSGEHFNPGVFVLDAVNAAMLRAAASYKLMLRDGVAPEMARMILPQNMYTMWVETGSLWYWYGFVKQRIDPHAQWEIQQYAKAIDGVMKEIFPASWKVCMDRDSAIKRRHYDELVTALIAEGVLRLEAVGDVSVVIENLLQSKE